jgi:beta-glucosidase
MKMREEIFDLKTYASLARQVAAEGIIMLRNHNQVLPLAESSKVALFGRSQFNYYKSGTGSGGMVNASSVTGIREALLQDSRITLNSYLSRVYEKWLEDNPFVEGIGWGNEPWFQEEMPITSEIVDTAKKDSDVAIVIIGRTAGEDQDNKNAKGSYLLTDNEHFLLEKVCSTFDKTIVLLNVGNIIDMKWVKKYQPHGVLLVWQGGQEGGWGVLDVLKGTISPSGKLTDTIAYNIEDYPSHANFGDENQLFYAEDIYVGYRYFETFAKDKVIYPFGYGLSYTHFNKELVEKIEDEKEIKFTIKVSNTGAYSGKEVVQLYCGPPQGKLGKPARNLAGFAKTNTLKPGESEIVTVTCSKYYLASYDDSGVTGYPHSYVLEAGDYNFYLGDDVRVALICASVSVDELVVLEKLQEASAPVIPFKRMRATETTKTTDTNQAADTTNVTEITKAGGRKFDLTWEDVPLRQVNPNKRREENLPKDLEYTGDRGWKLADVEAGKVSMEEFIAQLSDEDLCCIVRGEGMCSPKVTPGTGGSFGGVTDSLLGFGIPIACCSDGASGLRMDCGTTAFSLPNGVCMASTFNEKLLTKLYEFQAIEMRKNHIDLILSPAVNLHRHPLNGRNFEYFSEDPYLSGKIAVAQMTGLHKYGVTGTLKHYVCNDQEYRRYFADAIISVRALREIYLRCFEIPLKETGGFAVMSSYNPVNGFWTASSYDLLITILREEWGFDGIVVTDWWAKGNDEGEEGTLGNVAAKVRGGNDLDMVTRNALENTNNDNSEEALKKGWARRGEYQRCAMNICKAILKLPVWERSQGIKTELDAHLESIVEEVDLSTLKTEPMELLDSVNINPQDIDTGNNRTNLFQLNLKNAGCCKISITCRSGIKEDMAQLPFTVFWNGKIVQTVTLIGTDRDWRRIELTMPPAEEGEHFLKLFYSLGGIEIQDFLVELV